MYGRLLQTNQKLQDPIRGLQNLLGENSNQQWTVVSLQMRRDYLIRPWGVPDQMDGRQKEERRKLAAM